MAYTLDEKLEKILRKNVEKAKPYAADEKRELYFDYVSDRELSTTAMEMLKDAGLWTDEDEKKYMTKPPANPGKEVK